MLQPRSNAFIWLILKASTLQVSDCPYDEESISTIPSVTYELPNGFSDEYGPERFKIPEALFDPSHIRSPHAGSMLGAAHVVTTSVGRCPSQLTEATMIGNEVRPATIA